MRDKWFNNLDDEERRILNYIAGALSLPEFYKYESKAHFLHDIYNRVCQAKSIIDSLKKTFGGDD